ncbi:MAG: hypothetical protein N3J91_12540 [Verrucomicrobiae bacterium]|nr:hypothetical protein [Verrucomicrobiae bacterium]
MIPKPPPPPENKPRPEPSLVVPEVLPAAAESTSQPAIGAQSLPRWLNRKKLILAFIIAALSDALSIAFQLVLPLQLGLDFLTALLLFVVLGWRWPLLAGLLMEALPGVAVFPAWILVVAAIAALGEVRPRFR